MAGEFHVVDIWVGKFRSEEEFAEYMAERFMEDGSPISRFAEDQGVAFYDHDFLETGFREETDDVLQLLGGHSFAPSYAEAANRAFEAAGLKSKNALILLFGREIPRPRSAEAPAYRLDYLGRFDCDPTCETSPDAGYDEPPDRIYLIVETETPLPACNGQQKFVVSVDKRGLVIGNSKRPSSAPHIDLSPAVDGVSEEEVKIYRDPFGQWILDFCPNTTGRTEVMGKEPSGRTFAMEGLRWTIGSVRFTWSMTAPEDRTA